MITIFESYNNNLNIGDYIIMNKNCSSMEWYNIYGQILKYSKISGLMTIQIMNNLSKLELSNMLGLKARKNEHGFICSVCIDYVNKYEPDEFFKKVEEIETEHDVKKYNL